MCVAAMAGKARKRVEEEWARKAEKAKETRRALLRDGKKDEFLRRI